MEPKPPPEAPKLVTWKHWVLMSTAIVVGTGRSAYSEYTTTGAVEAESIWISIGTLAICVFIMVTTFTYANRPEPESHDGPRKP